MGHAKIRTSPTPTEEGPDPDWLRTVIMVSTAQPRDPAHSARPHHHRPRDSAGGRPRLHPPTGAFSASAR
jgi:hypothetical protein